MGWIGDGATAEGDFHSAMTFASVYNAPVILAMVNNQWAISSFSGHRRRRARDLRPARIGYGIAGLRVDGNDVLAVYAATQWAAERARSNHGPTLIEFFTYRAEGHSTSRRPNRLSARGRAQGWPLGDPIERLKEHLIAHRRMGRGAAHGDDRRVPTTRSAPRRRRPRSSASFPSRARTTSARMFEDVYAEVPWHLAEQRDQALCEGGD